MSFYLNSLRIRDLLKRHGVSYTMSLFFILDVINFYIDRSQGLNTSNSVSFYGKGVVEIVLILLLLIRRRKLPLLMIIFAFTTLPLIGYGLFTFSAGKEINYSHLFQLFKEGNKYVFPMLLFMVFQAFNVKWEHIKRVFESIFILCSVIVIVAFAFDISFFHTYGGSRFGFKPPFSTQNEITFFWFIGIMYFGSVLQKEKNIKYALPLLMLLFASLLLGTKAIALIVFLYSLFIFLTVKRISTKQKITGIALSIVVLCIFAYASDLYSFFYARYQNQGLLYAITSKRNLLFEHRVLPLLGEWKWYNIFTGGTFIQMPVTEMDLVDLFLFSGLIGFVLFFFILRKTMFSFSKKNSTGLFLVSQFIIIGALTGHIFSSGINAIYLAALCYYLQTSYFDKAGSLSAKKADPTQGRDDDHGEQVNLRN